MFDEVQLPDIARSEYARNPVGADVVAAGNGMSGIIRLDGGNQGPVLVLATEPVEFDRAALAADDELDAEHELAGDDEAPSGKPRDLAQPIRGPPRRRGKSPTQLIAIGKAAGAGPVKKLNSDGSVEFYPPGALDPSELRNDLIEPPPSFLKRVH
jgi:hypothetical protein